MQLACLTEVLEGNGIDVASLLTDLLHQRHAYEEEGEGSEEEDALTQSEEEAEDVAECGTLDNAEAGEEEEVRVAGAVREDANAFTDDVVSQLLPGMCYSLIACHSTLTELGPSAPTHTYAQAEQSVMYS